MKAYVINLDSRSDRWADVMAQQSILGLEIHRVPAVSIESVLASPYVTPVISATWQSHQKAMRAFLNTSEEYALIMEDDFVLSRRWGKDRLQVGTNIGADFLQVGFLITNAFDRLQIILSGTFDGFLKMLRNLTNLYRDWETDRKSTRLNSSHRL